MRTPARPRLPDGDCVFISGATIVARANALSSGGDAPFYSPPAAPSELDLLFKGKQ